jgi:hypothetical protein
MDQTSVREGIGGYVIDSDNAGGTTTATVFAGTGSVVTITTPGGTTYFPTGSNVTLAGFTITTGADINGVREVTGGSATTITFAGTASVCSVLGTVTGVAAASNLKYGAANTRQKYIQGISGTALASTPTHFTGGSGFGSTGDVNLPGGNTYPAGSVSRRYQVNFALGLFTQDKLIPVKFMASQLAIEITLEQPQACLFMPSKNTATAAASVLSAQNLGFTAALSSLPSYAVGNVNLIPEILQFDASYGKIMILM